MNSFKVSLLWSLLFIACDNGGKTKSKSAEIIGCFSTLTNDKDWYTSGKTAPLFTGLEGINFQITTANPKVQDYFNQGMMLAYGFNHAESARSFYQAIRLDSNCAMAYWGYAYVLGPNYNGGMEDDNYQRAFAAIVKAQSLSKNCRPEEVSLINALATRYEKQPPSDRRHLDVAYSAAMKKVYSLYSSNPDVGALYAESLMNLHPWDLYHKETKEPKGWTSEIIAVLEHLMKANPNHPGAHHFYIHAMEASATPEKALASARLLDTLVSGSGHLVHMPSHIYIITGDYHQGTLANLQAVAVDSVYTTACHAQGVYPLSYYPHNFHFLTATAALEGNSKLSWYAALKLQQHTAKDLMQDAKWGTLQHYYTIPYYVAVKFEKWDTVLAIPAPPQELIYPVAIWHYARGMAYAGKGNLVNALSEADSLRALAADTSLKHLTVWGINTMADLAQIAEKVLSGVIAAKQNNMGRSVSLFKEAVAIEDKLNYNEPPDWFFSVRHHLGAAYIKAEKYAEAEETYRQDLKTWKNNGWALKGLYNSLMFQRRYNDAQTIKSAFDRAWQYADVEIESSSGVINL